MPKRTSSIETELPEDVKQDLDRMVASGEWSITGITEWLHEKGYEISRSAVGRHHKKIEAVAENVRKSRQMAEALTTQFGDQFANSKQGEMLGGILRTLVFECMTTAMEDGKEVDPKNLAFLSKAIKDCSSAMRLDQDYEKNVRTQIEKEERSKAADSAAETMSEAGLSEDQVKFWREQFLGVKSPSKEAEEK